MAGTRRSRALALVSVFAASLALSGCGLPPILSFASYALDGISLLASGKSVSDHAISAVTEEDCALFRVVMGTPVCRDETEPTAEESVVANYAPAPMDPGLVDENDATGDHFVVTPDSRPLAGQLQTASRRGLVVPGLDQGTEVYALMQEDGALEIYAHLPEDTRRRSNLRMILKIDDYVENPKAPRGVEVNGIYFSIDDILV